MLVHKKFIYRNINWTLRLECQPQRSFILVLPGKGKFLPGFTLTMLWLKIPPSSLGDNVWLLSEVLVPGNFRLLRRAFCVRISSMRLLIYFSGLPNAIITILLPGYCWFWSGGCFISYDPFDILKKIVKNWCSSFSHLQIEGGLENLLCHCCILNRLRQNSAIGN